MKKFIYLISFNILTFFGYSQGITIINENNVAGKISTNGVFFNDQTNGGTSYEAPIGGGVNAIYASSFWFGGLDQNGDLHFAGQKDGTGQDLFNGPIADDYSTQGYLATYDTQLWVVSRDEIETHTASFQQSGYSVPNTISRWPGNGNIGNGEAEELAPFVDVNSNGVYDPENGDYPNIRGDKAVYLIMNDDAGAHTVSGGNPLKMEFHFMFYQYVTDDYLDNTTFVNVKAINRSQRTYSDFKVAFFMDPDIGGSNDDYIGCSPGKRMMYAYNSDNIDSTDVSPGMSTYGVNPPAIGVKFLNQSLDVFGYFNNAGGIQGDPTMAAQFWGLMNAQWGTSGVNFTQGGTGVNGNTATNYLYPGNPQNPNGWSEVSENNLAGDRRMFGVAPGVPLFPNQSICYDYAILYNRDGGDNLSNVNGLYSLADQVQAFFDSQNNYTCETIVLNINDIDVSKPLKVYPNPSKNNFRIELDGDFDVNVYSTTGSLVLKYKSVNSNQTLTHSLAKGIYVVEVINGDVIYNKKIVVQ